MLSRKQGRWVIPAALILAVVVYFYYDQPAYGSNAGWMSLPKWSGGKGEQSLLDAPGLVKEAHRLKHADDFLPHFQAVLKEVEPLTKHAAQASCDWTPEELWRIDFQFSRDEDWVRDDQSRDIMWHREEWHKFIANYMVPWEQVKNKFQGRGIVVLAGNGETVKRLKVALTFMVNYTIPVEVHYWDDELKEQDMNDIKSAYHSITFNNLADDSNLFKTNKNIFFINYQLKTAALLNSRFAEPFLIDSDNIPLIDPLELYESKTYKKYGTIFWPDIARTRPENPMWAITNTRCRKNEYEQESGQLLVDKRRFWYHLQLAQHFEHDPTEYYKKFLLGDKDTFRFAWHALKTDYGKPSRWVASVGIFFPDGKWCGHSFAQHHPDVNGSVAFFHGGLLKTLQPSLLRWLTEEYHTKIYQSYKRSDNDQDPNYIEPVHITWTKAEFAEPEPKFEASCHDMPEVMIRNPDDLYPNFDALFNASGGYWITEGEDH